MGLETASFISQLISTNPLSGDKKQQGDDHLRLIKAAVQGSLPTSAKAWYNPDSAAKTLDFSILAADMNKTFLVSTAAGAVTGTLPTLAAGDAGWECFFIKTNTDVTSFWIAPAAGVVQSGDISGLAKTRRVIPGVRVSALWSGSAWYISRSVQAPVGSVIDFFGAALPVGYEWPSGQTLSGSGGSIYPDYFLKTGSLGTPDLRGRAVFGRDDMGGSVAGRLTNAGSGIDGTTVTAVGGNEAVTLAQGNLPNVNFAVNIPSGQGSHAHGLNNATNVWKSVGGNLQLTQTNASISTVQNITVQDATLPTMTGTAASGGAATPVNKMPPAVVLHKILVVE